MNSSTLYKLVSAMSSRFTKRPWYLATPYAKYPGGHEAAFKLAADQCAFLVSNGILVFSPIAHSHPLAQSGRLNNFEHADWLDFDKGFMRVCWGCIMLRAESWEQSKGMGIERRYFELVKKPIIWMTPGIVPEELRICV